MMLLQAIFVHSDIENELNDFFSRRGNKLCVHYEIFNSNRPMNEMLCQSHVKD